MRERAKAIGRPAAECMQLFFRFRRLD